jgi:hypothetical protein
MDIFQIVNTWDQLTRHFRDLLRTHTCTALAYPYFLTRRLSPSLPLSLNIHVHSISIIFSLSISLSLYFPFVVYIRAVNPPVGGWGEGVGGVSFPHRLPANATLPPNRGRRCYRRRLTPAFSLFLSRSRSRSRSRALSLARSVSLSLSLSLSLLVPV